MVRFIPQFKGSGAKDNGSVPPELDPKSNLASPEEISTEDYLASLYGEIKPEAEKSNQAMILDQHSAAQTTNNSRQRKSLWPQVWGLTLEGLKNTGNVLRFRFVKGRWRWYILGALALGTAGTAAGGYWAWLEVESSIPNHQIHERVMKYVRSGAVTIKASDGHIIHQSGPVTQEQLKFAQIPPRLSQAFVAIEDRRFREHDGVDYQGIVRAVSSNIQSGQVVEGGSTITQQLARIIFLNQERTYWRKLRESRLAQKIEENATKNEILERYLNLVYLGSGAYGVADAAWVYFSKPVHQLTLAEMATIAGLAPAPTEYSPLVNKDAAKRRRNLVLQQMAESGFITPAEAKESIASPLEVKPSPHKATVQEASYFVDYIKTELPKYVTPETLANGGLIIETTLNRPWQQAAEKVVQETVAEDGQSDGFSQAAMVAIDPRNGEVKAMVGGNDYQKQKFNRATQAMRQPGSTFKGLLYTTAIAAGLSPYKSYVDAELTIDDYKPKNYGGKFRGSVSMKDALTSSLNIVAIKVLLDVGWNPVITLSKKMGIQSELKSTYSLALGSSEVNLLELTSAYGTLANKGVHQSSHGIRRITDQTGKIIYDAPGRPIQAIDKDTAAIMTWMLQGVVDSGTGNAASLADRPVAGKTGTSDESRDLWFIGYIPQMVTGVWLGNDNNEPTWGMSSAAARAWGLFMTTAVKDLPSQPFPELPSLEREATIQVEPIRPAKINMAASSGEAASEGRSSSRDRDENSSSTNNDNNYSSGSTARDNDTYTPPAPSGNSYVAPPEVNSSPEPVASETPSLPAPSSDPIVPEPVAPVTPAPPEPAASPASVPSP